jgi:hypothetical protein
MKSKIGKRVKYTGVIFVGDTKLSLLRCMKY